jgi:hypothetical protein
MKYGKKILENCGGMFRVTIVSGQINRLRAS